LGYAGGNGGGLGRHRRAGGGDLAAGAVSGNPRRCK
jgi:hypothetical protein